MLYDLAHWEKRYAGSDYLYGTLPTAFLQEQAGLLQPGLSVLAVADGEGRNGVWLAERGLAVTAVEFSPAAIAKAQQLAAERGVSLTSIQADLSSWTFPTAAFDVVVAVFFQFAGPELRERIFAGIRQALKPGGLLLLEGYRTEQLAYGTGGPGKLEYLYSRQMLEHAFGDWESVQLREYDVELAEGTRHRGMSALIDLVARKPAA